MDVDNQLRSVFVQTGPEGSPESSEVQGLVGGLMGSQVCKTGSASGSAEVLNYLREHFVYLTVSIPLTSRARRRIAELILNLDSDVGRVSELAEQVLIRYYASRAVPQLLEQIAHNNPVVRFRVAWVLGKSKDPRAFEALLQLTKDPVESVRYDSVMALGHLGDPRAIEPLVELLNTSNPHVEGMAAGNALEMFGDAALPHFLADACSDQAEIRVRAAYRLAGLPNTLAVQAFQQLASDPDETVRLAVIDAIL